jgi:hypothetical protein
MDFIKKNKKYKADERKKSEIKSYSNLGGFS